MTNILSPSPVAKFFDNNGAPLAFGLLFTYEAGTTTKLATYQTSSGTANANPIVLNARGECDLWIPPNTAYKYVLAPAGDTDPPTNPIKTVDAVIQSQLLTLYGGVDTGAVNAYVLTFTAPFSSYVDGTTIDWTPAHSNSGASTVNVNGIGIVPIVNPSGGALIANQIVANYIVTMIYSGGKFILVSSSSFAPPLATGSAVLTALGLTTSPTGIAYWISAGGIFMMTLPGISGTSNAATFSLAGLPSNLFLPLNGITQNTPLIPATDNGARVTDVQAQFVANSGTILLLKGGSGAGWTNSGTKGVIANTVISWWYDPHGIL